MYNTGVNNADRCVNAIHAGARRRLWLEAKGAMMDEAKVMGVLKRVEWGGFDRFCPWCHHPQSGGHADDCKLAALLAESDGLLPGIDLRPEHTAEALIVARSAEQGALMVGDLLKLFSLFGVPEDAGLYVCHPLDPDQRFVIRRVRPAKDKPPKE